MRGLAILLVSCASHPAPIANRNDGPVAPRPVGPYGAMFESGKQWTFPLEALTNSDGGPHPANEIVARGELHCRVADAHPIANGWASTITCAPAPATIAPAWTLAGTYVATTEGLWRVVDPGTRPDPKQMVIGATPKIGHVVFDGGERYIEGYDRGWCIQTNGVAEVNLWSLCLRDGDVIGGGSYSNGVFYWGDILRTN